MPLDVLLLLAQYSPSTPTRTPDSGWEIGPLLLLPVVVLVAGTALACALRYRGGGEWALTPGRAVGIPVVVASALLLTFAALRGPSVVVDPFTWPLTVLAAIHGLGVVGGAALRQRRWGYVAAAGTATVLGALVAASWGSGPGVFRPYLYLATVSVGPGVFSGYVTAGRWEQSDGRSTVRA